MLIYGNTPADIRKKILERKWKIISILSLIAVGLLLLGCTVGNKQVNPPLMALEKFWDTLGSGVDKTKSKDE